MRGCNLLKKETDLIRKVPKYIPIEGREEVPLVPDLSGKTTLNGTGE